MANRTPVIILTGSDGKSALLTRWLESAAFAGTAVLNNGAPGNAVTGGCFCCAGRGGLVQALRELLPKARRGDVARVVIGTAAGADPAAIADAIQSDLATASVFRLAHIVAFADSPADTDSVQLAAADRLVIAGGVSDVAAARFRAIAKGAEEFPENSPPAAFAG